VHAHCLRGGLAITAHLCCSPTGPLPIPTRGRIPSGPPVAVLPEEEGLPVPQGTFVAVPLEEEVPPEEEEFPAPAVAVSLTSQTLIPCIFSSQLFIAMLTGPSS
jgi:hypothetical protein